MTDNQQRAAAVASASAHRSGKTLENNIAAALDAAEARGRADGWDAGYAAAQLDADEEPYSDSPLRATWQPRQNPHREHEHTWVSTYADGFTSSHELCAVCRKRRTVTK